MILILRPVTMRPSTPVLESSRMEVLLALLLASSGSISLTVRRQEGSWPWESRCRLMSSKRRRGECLRRSLSDSSQVGADLYLETWRAGRGEGTSRLKVALPAAPVESLVASGSSSASSSLCGRK
jgi:hypothetical protein